MDSANNTKDNALVLDGIVSFVDFARRFIPEIKLDLSDLEVISPPDNLPGHIHRLFCCVFDCSATAVAELWVEYRHVIWKDYGQLRPISSEQLDRLNSFEDFTTATAVVEPSAWWPMDLTTTRRSELQA